MVIEHMTHHKSQIGNLSALEHMIALGDLNGQLKAFLLSCKVDELSPATLTDYEQKIGAFVRYCNQLNEGASPLQPAQVTPSHIRLFLLQLQERCNPVSVSDYYRCIKRFFNWMVAEGILEHSPMASMRSPRVPRKVIQPFTLYQIRDTLLLCNDGTFLGINVRPYQQTEYYQEWLAAPDGYKAWIAKQPSAEKEPELVTPQLSVVKVRELSLPALPAESLRGFSMSQVSEIGSMLSF